MIAPGAAKLIALGTPITVRRFARSLDVSRFHVVSLSHARTTLISILRSINRALDLPIRQRTSDLFDQALEDTRNDLVLPLWPVGSREQLFAEGGQHEAVPAEWCTRHGVPWWPPAGSVVGASPATVIVSIGWPNRQPSPVEDLLLDRYEASPFEADDDVLDSDPGEPDEIPF